MADILGGVFFLIVIAVFVRWVIRTIWGKCPYCDSTDLVPDHGLFFYCNGCKRKS